MKRFIVWSEWDGIHDEYATLAEAEDAAESLVERCRLDAQSDRCWNDDNGVRVMEVLRDWRLEETNLDEPNPDDDQPIHYDLVESADAGREIDRLAAELDAAVNAIHDLQQERQAWERGVQSERARVMNVLRRMAMDLTAEINARTSGPSPQSSAQVRFSQVMDAIDAVSCDAIADGKHLPPDAMRARITQSEAALRRIADTEWGSGASVTSLRDIAREALGGEHG